MYRVITFLWSTSVIFAQNVEMTLYLCQYWRCYSEFSNVGYSIFITFRQILLTIIRMHRYLSQLYSHPDWPNKTPKELQEELGRNIENSPFWLLNPQSLYTYVSRIVKKRQQGQPVSFTDFFGCLVGDTILKNVSLKKFKFLLFDSAQEGVELMDGGSRCEILGSELYDNWCVHVKYCSCRWNLNVLYVTICHSCTKPETFYISIIIDCIIVSQSQKLFTFYILLIATKYFAWFRQKISKILLVYTRRVASCHPNFFIT